MGARLAVPNHNNAVNICSSHAQAILNVRCDACSVARTPCSSNRYCASCIREHSVEHPTHVLAAFDPGSSFPREALAALAHTTLPTSYQGSRPASAVAASSVTSSPTTDNDVAEARNTATETPPLIACARRRALVLQAGLSSLEVNVETALMQLEANRDAGLAALQIGEQTDVDASAVLAVYASGVDAVHAAAATKRAGLETELVVADATLGEAIDATAALAEAAAVLDDAALALQAPALLARFSAAQVAVEAIPERPATSSFLAVVPAPGPEALRAPIAGLLGALATIWTLEHPADLSPEHATQLQAWLPPGGSASPGAWVEVYRATTHGFGAAAFHERCDGRKRLLVLVRVREGGWLFGGFTAVGFSPPQGWMADPSAFLFSLTNSLGRPERLESKQTERDLYYSPSASAIFGGLLIWGDANVEANSYTNPGNAFAAPASTGAHPMAQGPQEGWIAAEIVAWVV